MIGYSATAPSVTVIMPPDISPIERGGGPHGRPLSFGEFSCCTSILTIGNQSPQRNHWDDVVHVTHRFGIAPE
jgi:hypothetical protein